MRGWLVLPVLEGVNCGLCQKRMAADIFGTANRALRCDPYLYFHRAMQIHLPSDLRILGLLPGDELSLSIVLSSSGCDCQEAKKCDVSGAFHWLTSKDKAQHALHKSRIARSIDVAKGAGIGNVSVRTQELSVVEEIECLSTNFHL